MYLTAEVVTRINMKESCTGGGNIPNTKSQMRKGILEYCILLILKYKKVYSNDILEQLKASGMEIVEPTLYTLLKRLIKEEKVSYIWHESPKGPPRKYYSITDVGRSALEKLDEAWMEMNRSVSGIRGGLDAI